VLTAKGATISVSASTAAVRHRRSSSTNLTVKLGQNSTILIQLVEPAVKPTPAGKIGLKYKLVPFGG